VLISVCVSSDKEFKYFHASLLRSIVLGVAKSGSMILTQIETGFGLFHENIKPKTLRAILTISGNEVISSDDL
jgi:hypothetical protein